MDLLFVRYHGLELRSQSSPGSFEHGGTQTGAQLGELCTRFTLSRLLTAAPRSRSSWSPPARALEGLERSHSEKNPTSTPQASTKLETVSRLALFHQQQNLGWKKRNSPGRDGRRGPFWPISRGERDRF